MLQTAKNKKMKEAWLESPASVGKCSWRKQLRLPDFDCQLEFGALSPSLVCVPDTALRRATPVKVQGIHTNLVQAHLLFGILSSVFGNTTISDTMTKRASLGLGLGDYGSEDEDSEASSPGNNPDTGAPA